MSTLADCLYDSSSVSLGAQLINWDYVGTKVYGIYACTPFKWEYLVNLLCVLVWLVGFRWLYDLYMRMRRKGAEPPFNLSNQLTTRDNPTIAIDFSAFLFSMCLITRGSLNGLEPGVDTPRYFGAFFAYQAIGCIVIVISSVLNDKLMLRKICNIKAMVEERSVAVACVQAGMTIASALIFATAGGGEESSFGEGGVMTLIYWLIGQVRAPAGSLLMPPRRTHVLASLTDSVAPLFGGRCC